MIILHGLTIHSWQAKRGAKKRSYVEKRHHIPQPGSAFITPKSTTTMASLVSRSMLPCTPPHISSICHHARRSPPAPSFALTTSHANQAQSSRLSRCPKDHPLSPCPWPWRRRGPRLLPMGSTPCNCPARFPDHACTPNGSLSPTTLQPPP